MRENSEVISGLELSKHLINYSEIKEKYVFYLQKIIEQNSLTDFDKSILLPTKKLNLARTEQKKGLFSRTIRGKEAPPAAPCLNLRQH